MGSTVLAGILQNITVLLAVAFLFGIATSRTRSRGRPLKRLGIGAMLGLMAIGVMMASLRVEPGLIFDARSVVLGITGLFFGGLATAVAVAISAGYRIMEGGAGALTGVGVIVASAGIGLTWRHFRRDHLSELGLGELLLFGGAVHFAMLGLLFTLPDGLAFEVIPRVAPAVLVLFPLTTAALGFALVLRLRTAAAAVRLAESEERYRSIFEENQTVMLIIDPVDGRITDANPAAVAFYGLSRDRIRGSRMWDISTLPEKEARREIDHAMRRVHESFESRHRLADGTEREVKVHCGPITLDGRPHLFSIILDVSERVRILEELRAKEDRVRLLATATEATANPIVITDPGGTIEWVNPAFIELTGYSLEEAVGKNPRDLVNSGIHDRGFFQTLWQTILSGKVWRGELTNRKKNGELYKEAQTITPVRGSDGGISHFVAVKHDLSARHEMEARLQQAQKLETVGRLAGGIAHDFNNLLTVINGAAQLALAEIRSDSPLLRELTEIHEAGLRASRLTTQLLAFSRRQVLRPVTLDLTALATDLLKMIPRLLGEGVEVVAQLPDAPAWTRTDPGQMEQVIMNLALNARDAMPHGGRLRIDLDEVELKDQDPILRGRRRPGPYLRLTVEDSGTGIPPEVQLRMFEPFFTTKPAGKGTGLGLATVYGIVTQSGGEIDVHSEVDKGTRFDIYLPVSAEGPEDTAASSPVRDSNAPGDSRGVTETILIVEDEPTILRVATRILERSGYSVLGANSGRAALGLLDAHPDSIDLVFTDVVMPEMSGPQLIERIRERMPHVRVLFASGYVEEVLERHGVASEDEHFIGKPYSVEDLGAKVREVLAAPGPSEG